MKAWVREAKGGTDVYQWKDFDPVVPAEGEVQIKVLSSSVNPIDIMRRKYGLEAIGGPPDEFPVVDGYDVCGEVVRAGPGVSLVPKDVVFGDINGHSEMPQRFGSWAEYVTAKESVLGKLQAGMDPIAAGGIGVVFGTFLQAIEESGVQNPKKVLILGGAGGTGCAALQISKHILKADRIVTTASEKKFDFVKQMGADEVVNYRDKDFTEALAGEKFDLIYDTTKEAEKAAGLTSDKGMTITISAPVNADRVKFISYRPKAAFMEKIAPYIRDGTIKVPMQVFKASELPKALDLSESGRATGKIVLSFC